jgi:hypothetical protein
LRRYSAKLKNTQFDIIVLFIIPPFNIRSNIEQIKRCQYITTICWNIVVFDKTINTKQITNFTGDGTCDFQKPGENIATEMYYDVVAI